MANEPTQKEIDLHNSLNSVIFKRKDGKWVPQNKPPKVSQEMIEEIDLTEYNNAPTDTIYHHWRLD